MIAAATSSSESDIESDGVLDWSASECKDYKVGIATVACAASDSLKIEKDTWEWRGPCCLVRVHRQVRRYLFTTTWKEDIWQGLTVQPQQITHVKPQDRSFLTPVIEHVKSVEYLKPRKVSYPWTGETHSRVTPAACGNSVYRTTARILVPVSDMNPMAIADSGASHVFLPQSALFDSKSAKPVNLRLAAGEIQAVEAHWETFAEHVTIPLCPLERVIQKLQLIAIWTPQPLTLNCVNKSGIAQGLMQCPIKGDTPYFTAVQFWMLRRALQLQCKRQKHFPPSFLKQLYLAAIAEGPDLRMAAKGVEKGQAPLPDMSKRSLPQLSSYVTRILLGQGLLQAAQMTTSSKALSFQYVLKRSSLSSNVISCGAQSTTQRD